MGANAHMLMEQPIPMMPTPSVRAATTHMLNKPEPDWLHRCDSANRFNTLSLKPTNERARGWCEAEMCSEALQEVGSINSVSLCREHNVQTQAIALIKRDSDYCDDVDDEVCWMALDVEPQAVEVKSIIQQRRRRPSIPDIQPDALTAVAAVSADVKFVEKELLVLRISQRRRRASIPDIQPDALTAVEAVSADVKFVEKEPLVVSRISQRRRRASIPDIQPDALTAIEAVSADVKFVEKEPLVVSRISQRRRRPSLLL